MTIKATTATIDTSGSPCVLCVCLRISILSLQLAVHTARFPYNDFLYQTYDDLEEDNN